MESPETCQTCFRPKVVAASVQLQAQAPVQAQPPTQPQAQPQAQPQTQPQTQLPTQWISVCRCERPYSPSSNFSIDVCANCRLRVAASASGPVNCPGLCVCEKPAARKVPAYIKQNESDVEAMDLASLGMSPDAFPSERYTPLALLGNSVRATAILARDKQRGTKVAVKCFKRLTPAMKSTFESEVKKNQQLSHTNIAKIVDCGYHNGSAPYLVTEYKEGFNLEQCLALYGTPSYDVAVKILIGVCETLVYAQKQGVLHRDIRPGNIIFLDDLNSEPSVAILDFAMPKVKSSEKLTEPGDAMYITGDEARGLEYSERSEVYAIGCVGFALLAGRPPFQDGTALEIKNAHALTLPPRISNLKFDNTRPSDLEEIIERCLEKDPGARFESVAKLMERLEVFPRRVQMRIAAVLAARSKKKMLRVLAVVLVLLALCVVVGLLFAHRL